MSRVVQLANFVSPGSGGLRTTLAALGAGCAAAGHEVVQVLPAAHDGATGTGGVRQVLLRGTPLPGTGYRLLTSRRRVLAVLEQLQPDRVEVHDRTTLAWVGDWCRRQGVPSLVVSHERLDRWLREWADPRLPLDRAADRANATLAARYDAVVCTTGWAAREFARLAVPHLRTVPLGVDLERFRPAPSRGADGELRLVLASRLSREKRPDLAVRAAHELARRGHRVRLVVAGTGPQEAALRRLRGPATVELAGFVPDREAVARLLGQADAVLAPGPVETFGLAALEALACGTPVVANRHSALGEVLGGAGRTAPSTPRCFADAVEDLLAEPEGQRRARARQRAEGFPWAATVEGFLRVHGLPVGRPPARARDAEPTGSVHQRDALLSRGAAGGPAKQSR